MRNFLVHLLENAPFLDDRVMKKANNFQTAEVQSKDVAYKGVACIKKTCI